MPAIMITCPSTGKPVDTGVTTSKKKFERKSFDGYAMSCRHCKKVHAWTTSDAYLEDRSADHIPQRNEAVVGT